MVFFKYIFLKGFEAELQYRGGCNLGWDTRSLLFCLFFICIPSFYLAFLLPTKIRFFNGFGFISKLNGVIVKEGQRLNTFLYSFPANLKLISCLGVCVTMLFLFENHTVFL